MKLLRLALALVLFGSVAACSDLTTAPEIEEAQATQLGSGG